MKRITSFLSLAIVLMVVASGCLKDKGFEAQNYGIQISEIKGVAFPAASRSPLGYGLDVSATPQVVSDLVNVTIETGSPAESDVVVTLTNTSGTAAAGDIKAYNDEHGTNIQVLPTSLYSIPLTLTIPAGQKFVQADITVSNTTSLNPNLAYGIALTLTSATGGYQVAENQRKLLIIFSVKNKYDGRYRLTGYHNRNDQPYTFPYDTEIHLVTTGPASVVFYWPLVGSNGHPIGIGPTSMSWYGPGIAPEITFDPATDLVASLRNSAGGTVIDKFPGPYTGPPATPVGPRINRWNPADRSIIVDWRYNMNNFRAFFDNLSYLGAR